MLDSSTECELPVEDTERTTEKSSSEEFATSSDLEAALALFVDQYKGFAKQAAEHFVWKCSTVVEAEVDLPPEVFDRFCETVKLDKTSGTFRKYRKVGQNADRLLKVADRLPDNWTTLYELAKLETPEFDDLVNSGALHPEITASELSRACSKVRAGDKCVFRIDVTTLPDGRRVELLRKLQDLTEEYGVTVAGGPADLVTKCDMAGA